MDKLQNWTIELGLLVVLLLVMALKTMGITGSGLLMVVFFSTVSTIYFMGGWALAGFERFADVDFKEDLAKKPLLIITGGFTGWGLSVALLGMLFKMQHYPGAGLMLVVGGASMLICIVASVVGQCVQPNRLHIINMMRAALYGLACLAFFYGWVGW